MADESGEKLIEESLKIVYPKLTLKSRGIARFCLASLIYHKEFLKSRLNGNHPIFNSPLFTSPNLINRLEPLVSCVNLSSNSMHATGVPPHVSLLIRLTNISNAVSILGPNLASMPTQVAKEIEKILEERAIGAGTVTRDGLSDLLKNILKDSGLNRLIENMNSNAPIQESDSRGLEKNSNLNLPTNGVNYRWSNGLFYRLPEDFELSSVNNTLTAWQLWCCGNPSKGHPPYKSCESKDISKKNVKKRFTEYSYVMKHIQSKAQEAGIWTKDLNIQDANAIFLSIENQLGIPLVTPKGIKRRIQSLGFRQVYKILKKN